MQKSYTFDGRGNIGRYYNGKEYKMHVCKVGI